MKYHALFVIFEKAANFLNCCLLQIIGGTLWVNRSVNDLISKDYERTKLITYLDIYIYI